LSPVAWPRADGVDQRGVRFSCPACLDEHGDSYHQITVPWAAPSPFSNGHLWTLVDSNPETLTLSPSVDCTLGGGCKFHGWVQGGMVRW
jgi:hypothetical protein